MPSHLTTDDTNIKAARTFRFAANYLSGTESFFIPKTGVSINARPATRTEFNYTIEPDHLTLSNQIATRPNEHSTASLRSYVEGVITSHDDNSVHCRMRINSQPVTIELPRELFPEAIRYGLPIKLEMIDENGCRRPKISVREVAPEKTAAISAEFDSILAAI